LENKCRCEDKIRMNLREIYWEGVKCYVVDLCEHGNDLSGSIKGGKFLDWMSDS